MGLLRQARHELPSPAEGSLFPFRRSGRLTSRRYEAGQEAGDSGTIGTGAFNPERANLAPGPPFELTARTWLLARDGTETNTLAVNGHRLVSVDSDDNLDSEPLRIPTSRRMVPDQVSGQDCRGGQAPIKSLSPRPSTLEVGSTDHFEGISASLRGQARAEMARIHHRGPTMETLTSDQKEQARLQVLNSLLAELTLDQAATLMGVSARHTRRILAAYRREGAAALAAW